MNILFVMFVLLFPIECNNANVRRSTPVATHLSVTRVGPCADTRTVVRVAEMSVIRNNYDFSVTGQFNISVHLENGWSVTGVMQRCMDLRNTDTCDYFKSFSVITDGCNDVHNGDITDTFFHYTQPQIKCPVAAGVYNLVEYPFYTENNYLGVAESKISTSVFGYTMKLEGRYQKKKILCVEVYLQVVYLREHNWVNGSLIKKTPGGQLLDNHTEHNIFISGHNKSNISPQKDVI